MLPFFVHDALVTSEEAIQLPWPLNDVVAYVAKVGDRQRVVKMASAIKLKIAFMMAADREALYRHLLLDYVH
jgi:hypothetical protein